VLLSDLASLPGEDRGARLRQALAAYDEALALRRDVPLDYATTQNNRAVLLSDLASLPGEDRGARLRQALAAAAEAVRLFETYQHVQYLEVGRRTLAGVVVALGIGEFVAAWRELFPAADPPRLTAQELLMALAQGEDITSNEAFAQRMEIDSQFKARADELIAFALPQGKEEATDDPLAAGLAALLAADSDAALAQALADHPILAQADALFALAGLLNQALAAQQNEAVARLVVSLVVLVDAYNRAHSEGIALEAHQAVIDLCEQVIPLAEQISGELAQAFRQQTGWAGNTLGNHYADELKDLDQAVAAYTRGLAFDPRNAMLLRNRAGVHLDRRDWPAAQADIEAAAALQPDAPRLADLRATLEQLP
jgi:tetratricopeptide (TPR) repeat protein